MVSQIKEERICLGTPVNELSTPCRCTVVFQLLKAELRRDNLSRLWWSAFVSELEPVFDSLHREVPRQAPDRPIHQLPRSFPVTESLAPSQHCSTALALQLHA